ncbi:ABC transporter permease [Siccirubricoccus sp. KC 17139]|uniref:ABC transporter permease n=1 Tax=Siccirubricoccus soli TaxID=2899147 RepID=A0ABT1D837_9PROT|nr:ABC transporter permease [Siccirubricoccus soli]MCO6418104.1 ABC transporter permease [Siccirubricoccus soli]MCP2684239.1 ABC transporter permease [Siccirubricoccus soli]
MTAQVESVPLAAEQAAPAASAPRVPRAPLWQAAPLGLVLLLFFVLPLLATAVVSFWDYTEYSLVPDITLRNYREMFEGCADVSAGGCTTLRTYLSTFRLCAEVALVTVPLGFLVAYFLAFHVRGEGVRMALFLLCTAPFLTSNVIRMVSWIPLLGREGVVNQALLALRVVQQPQDWLLFSEFSVVLAFIHLYTLFVVVPVFNSLMRIDRRLIEAARDAGASAWQTLWHVVIPLAKPGIVIGAIFVIVLVMGDFVTIGVMGGQQIASVGKVIQVQMSYLQFPAAAAQAMVLLALVLLMIAVLTKLVDIRREL